MSRSWRISQLSLRSFVGHSSAQNFRRMLQVVPKGRFTGAGMCLAADQRVSEGQGKVAGYQRRVKAVTIHLCSSASRSRAPVHGARQNVLGSLLFGIAISGCYSTKHMTKQRNPSMTCRFRGGYRLFLVTNEPYRTAVKWHSSSQSQWD